MTGLSGIADLLGEHAYRPRGTSPGVAQICACGFMSYKVGLDYPHTQKQHIEHLASILDAHTADAVEAARAEGDKVRADYEALIEEKDEEYNRVDSRCDELGTENDELRKALVVSEHNRQRAALAAGPGAEAAERALAARMTQLADEWDHRASCSIPGTKSVAADDLRAALLRPDAGVTEWVSKVPASAAIACIEPPHCTNADCPARPVAAPDTEGA